MIMRKLMFRVWDLSTSTLLPTSDGIMFWNVSKKKFGVTNFLMDQRYLVTVLCLRNGNTDIYGLDVVKVWPKDYISLKEAKESNAPIQTVLCDPDGFVTVDGEKIHVTELHHHYNFSGEGFAAYSDTYKEMFWDQLSWYGIH